MYVVCTHLLTKFSSIVQEDHESLGNAYSLTLILYYLNNSYIGFTLKMESVSKNIIFGLKMIVKSGLENFFLKSLHAGR